jgi:two-component system response regulator EvgA
MDERVRLRTVAEVLIVEDHEHLAMGLELIFDGSEDFHVAGIARDFPAAARLIQESRVDLVILDINLPSGSGLDLLPTLRQTQPSARIIIFSQEDPIVFGPIARDLGAHGYLRKGSSLTAILDAARSVMANEEFFDGILRIDASSDGIVEGHRGKLW